jgi:hypothetical protein
VNARHFSLLLILAASAPATAKGHLDQASAREPGSAFHQCSAKREFTLPGRGGGPALSAIRNGKAVTVEPGSGKESIWGSIQVDPDGRTRALHLAWVQGGFAWPYMWRQDLGPIEMTVIFDRAAPGPAAASFDPAQLQVQISVYSARKLKRSLVFRLWRDDQPDGTLGLGGQAAIPLWLYSAQVKLSWADLSAFAKAAHELNYDVAEPVHVGSLEGPRRLSSGKLDLSIMPAVIDAFRSAEGDLLALAAHKEQLCTPQVEPEPGPGASISATGKP